MAVLSTWKVRGMRGLEIIETFVSAFNEHDAVTTARSRMGFWFIFQARRMDW